MREIFDGEGAGLFGTVEKNFVDEVADDDKNKQGKGDFEKVERGEIVGGEFTTEDGTAGENCGGGGGGGRGGRGRNGRARFRDSNFRRRSKHIYNEQNIFPI